MLISVIIPFFDELSLISRAAESVISNRSPLYDFEIVICNDGSLSNSQVLGALTMEAQSITIILPNRYASGPGGARNTALDACSGSMIAFLDADDIWLVGKISSQVDAILAGRSFVVTGYRFDLNNLAISPPKSINTPLEIFSKRGIGTSTVLITRELLGSNRFRDLRFSQDIDYWFRLSSQPNFSYFSVPMCSVIYSTSGSTKNKLLQLLSVWTVLRVNQIAPFSQVRILLSYSLNGIYNHYLKNLMTKWMP